MQFEEQRKCKIHWAEHRVCKCSFAVASYVKGYLFGRCQGVNMDVGDSKMIFDVYSSVSQRKGDIVKKLTKNNPQTRLDLYKINVHITNMKRTNII